MPVSLPSWMIYGAAATGHPPDVTWPRWKSPSQGTALLPIPGSGGRISSAIDTWRSCAGRGEIGTRTGRHAMEKLSATWRTTAKRNTA
jgi:hypothetical protein